MSESLFNYPIDSSTLLKKKRRLKKELLANNCPYIHKKIAVLGGSTTNEVVDQLELFLLHHGISAEFYQSEYGQFWQDAMFGNSELDKFEPDFIYIHTNWRNISVFPGISDTPENVSELLDQEYHRFESMWDALQSKFSCPIIQNNFDRPNYRLLGNKDIADIHGRSNFLFQLNAKFYNYENSHRNFYINDIDYLSGDYGLSAWNDALYWNMYKYAMCLDAIPHLACSIANIIKSILGKNKKLIALDLDNTLWGGIVGDDGVEGIKIGPEVPSGQVYAEFQNYCKNLKSIGAVLAVNSKNEEDNAIAGLNHPDGILRPSDFVTIKANWQPKDQNLSEIARELNLGADSFVFVDDNPAERAIVKAQIPGIAVPDIGQVEDYIRVLDHCGYFEVTSLSQEDMNKTALYHAKAEAAKAQALFTDYGDFLDSLEMNAVIRKPEPIYIQRIAQLTNKSNQFNLTTLRCTEEDISAAVDSDNHIFLYGKLVDKFTDNGLVTVVSGEIEDSILHIRLWLMSCRVLKRGLENAMMNSLVAIAKARGITCIKGYYYPTAKNAMVKNFYGDMQFTLESEDDHGNTTWTLNVDRYKDFPIHMTVTA